VNYLEFFSLLATLLGIFFWSRSESRSDIRHMETKIDLYRQETNDMIKAIQIEMKDFHNRLCAIEERNRGK